MSFPIFLALFFVAAAIWVAIIWSKRASTIKNEEIREHSNSSQIASLPQYPASTEDLSAKLESQMARALEEHNAFVERLVDKHFSVLSKKIRRHLRVDEYGKETGYNEVGDEIAHFLSHVVGTEPGYRVMRQRLIDLKIDFMLLGHNRHDYHLDRLALDEGEKFDEGLVPWVYALTDQHELGVEAEIDLLSGADFEIYCEDRLKRLGWSVHRKGGVGDQGVDLIARRNNTVVAIQCKRYATPIGNHAIQQVEAGRQFEEAHYAAVVSNTSYTRSAQQLASKLNVLLLHHSELDMLDEHLKLN